MTNCNLLKKYLDLLYSYDVYRVYIQSSQCTPYMYSKHLRGCERTYYVFFLSDP